MVPSEIMNHAGRKGGPQGVQHGQNVDDFLGDGAAHRTQVTGGCLAEQVGRARSDASVPGGLRRSGSPRAARHKSAWSPRSAGQSPPRTRVRRRPEGVLSKNSIDAIGRSERV